VTKVAQDIPDRLLHDAPISRLARHEVRVEVRAGEESLVVEHLLEVGDEPVGVGRVTMEPAADLVVHSAGGHGVE
jgi:hypothetical protein